MKRGLSTVITTLIIVLLVLVSIAVIWNVVSNLLDKGGDMIESSAHCLAVEIKALNVVEKGDEIYEVTFSRVPAGDGKFGAKVIFYNDSKISMTQNAGYFFSPFEVFTVEMNGTGIINANKIDVAPYYVDSEGKDKICGTKSTLEFQSDYFPEEVGNEDDEPTDDIDKFQNCDYASLKVVSYFDYNPEDYEFQIENIGEAGELSFVISPSNKTLEGPKDIKMEPIVYIPQGGIKILKIENTQVSNPTKIIIKPMLTNGTICESQQITYIPPSK